MANIALDCTGTVQGFGKDGGLGLEALSPETFCKSSTIQNFAYNFRFQEILNSQATPRRPCH